VAIGAGGFIETVRKLQGTGTSLREGWTHMSKIRVYEPGQKMGIDNKELWPCHARVEAKSHSVVDEVDANKLTAPPGQRG
jgi:hypothetical protein